MVTISNRYTKGSSKRCLKQIHREFDERQFRGANYMATSSITSRSWWSPLLVVSIIALYIYRVLFIYIFVYIYNICLYICLYIYVYIYMYIYINIYIYVYIYMCVFIYVFIYIYVYIYICMCENNKLPI